jgi:hypothetical protein
MVTCALKESFMLEGIMIQEKTVTLVETRRDGVAYRSGWQDGRFGQPGTFTANANVSAWEDLDRLAYYQGHRDGCQVREMLRVGRKTL